jgi:hypothetical protein
MENRQIEFIELNNLHLDFKNPRLPTTFANEGVEESDIIHWMLEDASIIELMLAIGQNGFFVGEALLVVKKDKGYVVIEGNRRLTSLKLLQTPSLASIHTKKIDKVLEETIERPTIIPCIVFDSREDIMQYLGFRHVTGIKSWGMLAKARYLYSLLPTLQSKTLSKQSRELAKKIGSKSDYVKRVLIGYEIYKIIKDNNFYQIPQLDETTLHFNYIADSLRHENIRNFINIDLDNENTIDEIEENHLSILIDLFFRKNEQHRSRVLGNSDNLIKLNQVLGNEESLKALIKDAKSLNEAHGLVEMSSDTFYHQLQASLKDLKIAHSYIHKIKSHNSSDIETLKEIVSLCKIMRDTITNKTDEWDI